VTCFAPGTAPDRPGRPSAVCPGKQWLTALPELRRALQYAGDPGTPTTHLLLERAWASLAQRLSTCAASASVTLRQTRLAQLGQPLAAVTSAATATQAQVGAPDLDLLTRRWP
jgi:hypothetical protein